jgi:hypothetical protein
MNKSKDWLAREVMALYRDVEHLQNNAPARNDGPTRAHMAEHLAAVIPAAIEKAMKESDKARQAKHFSDYHEDFGFVIWWRAPICEPPWVGSPDCSDWPFDFEDEGSLWWTTLIEPEIPQE